MQCMIPRSFWNGKSVLLTGGSSGIGRALAAGVAAAGGRVGIIARRQAELEAVAAAISAAGGTAAAAACDATDDAAVGAAVSALEEALGPVDVAIACAGQHRVSWPLDARRARAVLAVNVGGTVSFFGAVLPGMLERGRGHLCGVASIGALLGLPENAAYCASKAAVVTFLESLRADCAVRGVRVTTVCPGYVDTPMVTDAERARGGLLTADAAARRILVAIERGRAEDWFPAGTALAARLVRALPAGLRTSVLRRLAPMPEAP